MDRMQLELLRKIMEVDFIRVDLNLFLDTHPEERQALMDYQRACQELKHLTNVYEEKFGPLTPTGFCPQEYPWRWIEDPWPWEIDYCNMGR